LVIGLLITTAPYREAENPEKAFVERVVKRLVELVGEGRTKALVKDLV
jgi:hypothetical protein